MATVVVAYTQGRINNRVHNSDPELFRNGLVIAWSTSPIFLFPVSKTKQIASYFVEPQKVRDGGYYLPNQITPLSGRLVQINNRDISGEYVSGLYLTWETLNRLNWEFRVVEPVNKEPKSGTEIASLLERDLINYSASLARRYRKNNAEY
ncbi:MAG: hypothetical protein ACK421_08375 [Pseudanabaenaceae cyanobacterium]